MLPYVITAIDSESDREFIEKLYLDFRLLMFSEIKKIINDQWVAEDIIQDVLVRLIGKVELLRSLERRHLAAYVVTAAKNRARNHIRSARRESLGFVEDIPMEPAAEFSLEDAVINSLLLERLIEDWDKLPESARELLERRYLLLQSDEEIASALGVKVGSVRMKMTRARRTALAMLEAGMKADL